MKRILFLLCCLVLAPFILTAYATDDVSSEVQQEPPASSNISSSETEISSEPDTSSEPVSSEEESVPESSDVAVSSEQPVSSRTEKQSQPEEQPAATTDNDSDDGRGTAILVFCYIITALIGLCLIGIIIANVYIPVANKKRELSCMTQNEPYEEGYDLGEHAPKRKKENRRPRGRM